MKKAVPFHILELIWKNKLMEVHFLKTLVIKYKEILYRSRIQLQNEKTKNIKLLYIIDMMSVNIVMCLKLTPT